MIGRKIVGIRPMTEKEMEIEGWAETWHGSGLVLELDDGSIIFPSRDEEGNGPGALFGQSAKGVPFVVLSSKKN